MSKYPSPFFHHFLRLRNSFSFPVLDVDLLILRVAPEDKTVTYLIIGLVVGVVVLLAIVLAVIFGVPSIRKRVFPHRNKTNYLHKTT